ncbi:MAG TPA: transposase [Polyangiaceae bacterium]|nr:transposase [Polyangiaceae bacterium]
MRRFLDDGRLPAHNNISELNLRRQVLGRRNWLFDGSDDGAAVHRVRLAARWRAPARNRASRLRLPQRLVLLAPRSPARTPPICKRLSSSRRQDGTYSDACARLPNSKICWVLGKRTQRSRLVA